MGSVTVPFPPGQAEAEVVRLGEPAPNAFESWNNFLNTEAAHRARPTLVGRVQSDARWRKAFSRRRRPSLLANLLHEGLGASPMRALVVHDLREEPRLRVRGQHRAGAHFKGKLHAFRCRRALRPRGERDLGAMVRRLGLGYVVEPGRSIGAPTRAMAAGAGRRAAAEGVCDAAVSTAQMAGLTVRGTPDRMTLPRHVAPIGPDSGEARRTGAECVRV